jgi:hypothetical protein
LDHFVEVFTTGQADAALARVDLILFRVFRADER